MNRQEYLEICEKSLRHYLTREDEDFNVDNSIMMLECYMICKQHLANHYYGDIICFLCASVCLDCLDPKFGPNSDNIGERFDRIHRYIHSTPSESGFKEHL